MPYAYMTRDKLLYQISVWRDPPPYNDHSVTELEEVFDGINIPDIFNTEPDDDEIPDDDMGMVLETTVDEEVYLKVRIEGSASVQQKLKDLSREYK